MTDLQTIADRVEIEALRGEYTDAVMMHHYGRVASLFTDDGAVRMPHIPAEAVTRAEIRAGIERLQGQCDYFVQTTHPGIIQLDGDIATGRAYLSELIRLRDGTSHLNYAIYHDRYQRTPDGWKFSERVYEIRYVDTTPLAGSAPDAAAGGAQAPLQPRAPALDLKDPTGSSHNRLFLPVSGHFVTPAVTGRSDLTAMSPAVLRRLSLQRPTT